MTYPEKVIEKLPVRAAIILRDYDHPTRADYARSLQAAAGERLFLVAGDIGLAEDIGAGGLHLAERDMGRIDELKRQRPNWFFSVSTHTEEAVRRAAQLGVDMALLAPVFPTETHPGGDVLGVAGFEAIARQASLPLYALGGITDGNAPQLQNSSAAGLAAIRGYVKTT